MPLETIYGHTISTKLLGPHPTLVDLGSNLGSFSHTMIKKFGCKSFAVEALPALFEKIPHSDSLKKFNFAVTEKTGFVKFNVSSNPEGNSIKPLMEESGETITIPSKNLEEFVREENIGNIDLLKMDIEGAEIEVLNSCSDGFLSGIRQITIEFHDFNGVVPPAEVKKCVDRFRRLGFMPVQTSLSSGLDSLFINRKLCGIGVLDSILIGFVQKWAAIVALRVKRETQPR
jgi:FkbM family methyltransferase